MLNSLIGGAYTFVLPFLLFLDGVDGSIDSSAECGEKVRAAVKRSIEPRSARGQKPVLMTLLDPEIQRFPDLLSWMYWRTKTDLYTLHEQTIGNC